MFTRTHHDDLLAKRGIIATQVLGITGPDVLNAIKGMHPADITRRARDMTEDHDKTPDLATLITRSLSTSVLDAKTLEMLRRNKGRMANHDSIDTVYDRDEDKGHDDDDRGPDPRYRFAQTLKSCAMPRYKKRAPIPRISVRDVGFPAGHLYGNPGTYALKPHFTDSANGIIMAPERAAPEKRTSFAQISDAARAADTISADTVDDRHGTMFGVTRALDRKRIQDGHAPRTFEEGATGVLDNHNAGSSLHTQFSAAQVDPRVAARDAQAILDMTEPAVRSNAPAPKPTQPVFIFAPAPGVH